MTRNCRGVAVAMFLVAFGVSGCRGAPTTVASPPPAKSELGFDDLRSARVDAWLPAGAAANRVRCTVPLSAADLADLRTLLANGVRVEAAAMPMFTTAEHGVLHTARGDYEFMVGEEKIAARTCRASCRPVGAPEGREELHLRWTEPVGERLMAALRSKLAANEAQATRVGHVRRQ